MESFSVNQNDKNYVFLSNQILLQSNFGLIFIRDYLYIDVHFDHSVDNWIVFCVSTFMHSLIQHIRLSTHEMRGIVPDAGDASESRAPALTELAFQEDGCR